MSSGFPVYYKGRKWMSTEHLYQASKYHEDAECIPATAKDPNTIANVRERIFHAKNCMAAKMTQKCAVAKGLVREDWSTQSIDNMRFVLELKLLAHPKVISDALKRSGERPIVEISRKDTFWGCEQRYSQKGTLLVGNNVLGMLWMDIRDRMHSIIQYGEAIEPQKFFLNQQDARIALFAEAAAVNIRKQVDIDILSEIRMKSKEKEE